MGPYSKTKDIKLTLPDGIYQEILYMMDKEQKWAYPQHFIIEAINEKLEIWEKEHPEFRDKFREEFRKSHS